MANTQKLFRNGDVGFIDWLECSAFNNTSRCRLVFSVGKIHDRYRTIQLR